MNKLILSLGLAVSLFFNPAARAQHAIPIELKSQLDRVAQVEGVGKIAYRAPLDGKTGPTLVLMHGVYGGASSVAFREILPLLDQAGYKVFIFDLLGTGYSDMPKMEYTVEALESVLNGFLTQVVKTPSVVVAESVSGVAALEVSKKSPELVSKVVMLSPTGIRTLAGEPATAQTLLYKGLMASDFAGRTFYQTLSTETSVSFYAKKAYYNKALVDSLRIAEGVIAGDRENQRWVTISFVGGRIHRKLADAALGVRAPVLAIFGANAESMTQDPNMVEQPAEFQAAWPELNVKIVNEAGTAVHREKPAEVAALIGSFAN